MAWWTRAAHLSVLDVLETSTLTVACAAPAGTDRHGRSAPTTATRGRCGGLGRLSTAAVWRFLGTSESVLRTSEMRLCVQLEQKHHQPTSFRKEASRRRQLQGLLGTMEGSVKTKRDRGWRWREKGGGRTSGASSTSPATRTVTTAEELSPASSGPRRCRSAPGELGGSERCGVGHCERGE
jgi:hypothetical protein